MADEIKTEIEATTETVISESVDTVDDTDDVEEDLLFGEEGAKALQEAKATISELQNKISQLSGSKTERELRLELSRKIKEIKKLQLEMTNKLDEKDNTIKAINLANSFYNEARLSNVNPKYFDLLLNSLKLDYNEGVAIVSSTNQTIEEYLLDKKLESPELFLAEGARGTGLSGSNSPESASIAMGNPSDFFANLNGIASGKVKVII